MRPRVRVVGCGPAAVSPGTNTSLVANAPRVLRLGLGLDVRRFPWALRALRVAAGERRGGSLQSPLVAVGRRGRPVLWRCQFPASRTAPLTALPITTARLVRALPPAVAAGLIAYGLISGTGALGALLPGLVSVLGGALAVRAQRRRDGPGSLLTRTVMAASLVAPAPLILASASGLAATFPSR